MQNTTHPHPTAMAKTEFEQCAGICHTGEFASSAIGRNFASDVAYELEQDYFGAMGALDRQRLEGRVA